MPDVSYIITIRHEGGSSGSGGSSPGVAPTVSGESATGDGNVIGDLYGAYQKATKIAPIAFAMKLIDSTVTREMNRVELRTGHSTYQERISWSYGVAKRTLSTGALLIGGIATNNPVAIGGAVLSAANRGIELMQAPRKTLTPFQSPTHKTKARPLGWMAIRSSQLLPRSVTANRLLR